MNLLYVPLFASIAFTVDLLLEAAYMIRRNADARLKDRAVGYVRRSTDRQEQSISDQKKALERYATENGLRLVEFYVDDAVSGTSTL